MLVSFVAVGLNLLCNWLFTFHLGWGHRGLAFSTGLVASCNFLLLYALMRHHLQRLESARLGAMLLKVALASLALVAVCAAAQRWLLADWAQMAFLPKLTGLLATVLAGMVAFAAAGIALRIEELQELLAALRRRIVRDGTSG